jgi:hypothetical protein
MILLLFIFISPAALAISLSDAAISYAIFDYARLTASDSWLFSRDCQAYAIHIFAADAAFIADTAFRLFYIFRLLAFSSIFSLIFSIIFSQARILMRFHAAISMLSLLFRFFITPFFQRHRYFRRFRHCHCWLLFCRQLSYYIIGYCVFRYCIEEGQLSLIAPH